MVKILLLIFCIFISGCLQKQKYTCTVLPSETNTINSYQIQQQRYIEAVESNSKGIEYAEQKQWGPALDCFLVAHSLGLAEGTMNAVESYYLGRGTPESPQQAFMLLQNSSLSHSPFAYYIMGRALIEGKGIPKDFNKGYQSLQYSSQNGFWKATEYLKIIELQRSKKLSEKPKVKKKITIKKNKTTGTSDSIINKIKNTPYK